MKLGTIGQETAACRKAFAKSKVGDWAWHIHHTELCEEIMESIENRIQCILTVKPEHERALRLRLMRPISKRSQKVRDTACAEYEKVCATACAEYEKVRDTAHSKECPDCTWNGKTIFPNA